MQLKIVVLPAPFGPINPWIWPVSTWKVTRSTARSPPKLTDSSWREREVTNHSFPECSLHHTTRPAARIRPVPVDGWAMAGRCYSPDGQPVKRESPTGGVVLALGLGGSPSTTGRVTRRGPLRDLVRHRNAGMMCL